MYITISFLTILRLTAAASVGNAVIPKKSLGLGTANQAISN